MGVDTDLRGACSPMPQGSALELSLEGLARLELDHAAARDGNVHLGLVGVATNASLADLLLEYSEVAELDILPASQSSLDLVNGCLDNLAD